MKVWRQQLQALARGTLQDLDLAGQVQRLANTALASLRSQQRSCLVIAFGKAARSMAQGLLRALPGVPVRGLLVPPEGDAAAMPPLEVIPGGHPLPTTGSLAAGARALELAKGVRPDEAVVFLVSGGGSAMLEQPLLPSVTLAELRRCHAALVACGADIAAINTVRRRLSAIKGGRLLHAARHAACHFTLAAMDVPQGSRGALASGPTEAEPCDPGAALAVLEQYDLWPAVPESLRQALRENSLPTAPLASELPTAGFFVVQDPSSARRALERRAQQAGWQVLRERRLDGMPVAAAAELLLARLQRLRRRRSGRPLALCHSGELSVPLPAQHGCGGRSQQFALACAERMRGWPAAVLSFGTDGVDGNSPAAGAIADGSTCQRAQSIGFDVGRQLRGFDAYPLFAALGDAVLTGPTGNNLRDLRLAVWYR